MSTVANGDTREWKMRGPVSDERMEDVYTVANAFSPELSKHHRLFSSFPEASYPEFHGLLMGGVKDKFLRFAIKSSRCFDALDIRAVGELCQSKTAEAVHLCLG